MDQNPDLGNQLIQTMDSSQEFYGRCIMQPGEVCYLDWAREQEKTNWTRFDLFEGIHHDAGFNVSGKCSSGIIC